MCWNSHMHANRQFQSRSCSLFFWLQCPFMYFQAEKALHNTDYYPTSCTFDVDSTPKSGDVPHAIMSTTYEKTKDARKHFELHFHALRCSRGVPNISCLVCAIFLALQILIYTAYFLNVQKNFWALPMWVRSTCFTIRTLPVHSCSCRGKMRFFSLEHRQICIGTAIIPIILCMIKDDCASTHVSLPEPRIDASVGSSNGTSSVGTTFVEWVDHACFQGYQSFSKAQEKHKEEQCQALLVWELQFSKFYSMEFYCWSTDLTSQWPTCCCCSWWRCT